MPTYSAGDLIGKTLVANREMPVYNLPSYDSGAKEITRARKGNVLGVVYSYVGGQAGRPLNWQFKTPAGQFYYVEHAPNNFDTESLKEQGVQTPKEKAEAEAEAGKSTGDKILDAGKKIAWALVAVFATSQAVKLYQNRRT